MNERPHSIVSAEQQVAEARTTVLAEYQVTRAKLRRRMGSPVLIGGLLLGAIALGYLAFGRSKPKCPINPESSDRWSRVGKAVHVLLPLLIALNSATKDTHRPRASTSGTAG